MLFEKVPESFDFREARNHITLLFYQRTLVQILALARSFLFFFYQNLTRPEEIYEDQSLSVLPE